MPNPPWPPDIQNGTSSEQQLARMLAHPALDEMSVDEGSMPHAQLSPVANALAEGYYHLERMVEYRSLSGPPGHCAFGPWLDQIGIEEMGLPRRSAVPARIALTFFGVPGAVIPGTPTASPTSVRVRATTEEAPTYFITADVTIGASGQGGGVGECDTLGSVGNAPAGTVTDFVFAMPTDITGVINGYGQPLVAGADEELDNDYRLRLLEYRRDPPNGCNAAQFRTWAQAVPGCAKAQCVRPIEPVGPQGQLPPPPGNVWVYALDEDMHAATQSVVDVIQAVIAPSREIIGGPANFTPGGGAVVDPDGTIQLPAGGVDSIALDFWPTRQAELAGIWMWRPSLRVDAATGTLPICTIEVWNVTQGLTCPSQPPPNVNGNFAIRTILASELTTTFPPGPETAPSLDAYWNGTDLLEIRVYRQAANHAPEDTLWMDGGWIRSAFSAPEHEGLAPVDDRVECFVPVEIPIDITVTIWPEYGWTPADAAQSLLDAVTEYLKQVAYSTGTYMDPLGAVHDITISNDVIYGAVGAAIQTADGVERYDPATFLVNGAPSDIEIWKGDVAILGTNSVITVMTTRTATGWIVIGPPDAELYQGIIWRGAWDPTASYVVNDGVTDQGASYVCIAAHGPNPLPPDQNATMWEPV